MAPRIGVFSVAMPELNSAETEVAAGARSFAEQALHYFRRSHEGVVREPIAGAGAWRGEDLAQRDDWVVQLSADQISELEDAVRAAQQPGIALHAVRRENVPLGGLEAAIRSWAQQLDRGRGFLVLRGLPVERWGDELSTRIFWALGLHLGAPGAQNPEGDVLGHVIDTGDDVEDPFVRRYRTSGDIAFHCDLADVVALMCLRTSRRGGASRIASSVAVYNELLARAPEAVDRLYEPFLLDSRNESDEGRLPYAPIPPCRYAQGRLRTFYHSDYFRSVTRHPGVPDFTVEEVALLDLYEEIANSPELRLDMHFEPGDVQLVSNHTILHARTAYEDDAQAGEQRHLLRLWLSLESAEG